jgi:hypothetical protein
MRLFIPLALFGAVGVGCGSGRECPSQLAGTWFMADTLTDASSQFCNDVAHNRTPMNVGTVTQSGNDYLYSEGRNVETMQNDASTCTARTVLIRTENSASGQLSIERHLVFWFGYVDGWVVISTAAPDGTPCTANFTTHGQHASGV